MLTSVKYGAAPAYIRHRTADGQYSLSRISAGGGGGELYAVAEASARLSDGDMVLIVSDGAECGPALEKAILGVMTARIGKTGNRTAGCLRVAAVCQQFHTH